MVLPFNPDTWFCRAIPSAGLARAVRKEYTMGITVEHSFHGGLLMPHPIPLPVRQVIVQRAEQGQSADLIARSLGLVSRTVRQLLQRLRVQGKNALATSYPS